MFDCSVQSEHSHRVCPACLQTRCRAAKRRRRLRRRSSPTSAMVGAGGGVPTASPAHLWGTAGRGGAPQANNSQRQRRRHRAACKLHSAGRAECSSQAALRCTPSTTCRQQFCAQRYEFLTDPDKRKAWAQCSRAACAPLQPLCSPAHKHPSTNPAQPTRSSPTPKNARCTTATGRRASSRWAATAAAAATPTTSSRSELWPCVDVWGAHAAAVRPGQARRSVCGLAGAGARTASVLRPTRQTHSLCAQRSQQALEQHMHLGPPPPSLRRMFGNFGFGGGFGFGGQQEEETPKVGGEGSGPGQGTFVVLQRCRLDEGVDRGRERLRHTAQCCCRRELPPLFQQRPHACTLLQLPVSPLPRSHRATACMSSWR